MAKYYVPEDINTAERYNMQMVPIRQRQFLRPLTWLLSFPVTWIHHTKIKKIGMKGLKPPFLLLCNHNAFFDFQVTTRAIFPRRANYIISIDIFPGLDWIIRNVGGVYKRKFVTDTSVVRQLMKIVSNGDVAVLYPEARYSFVGTPCALPTSLGKLVKLLKVPVVTVITDGAWLRQPLYNNLRKRKAHEVLVRLAYAIGYAEPLEKTVIIDGEPEEIEGYDLTPQGIIRFLDLKRPIYEATARYGHYGEGFDWDE